MNIYKYLLISISIFILLLLPKIAAAGIIIRPVINTGLVGYWDFNEGAGSSVIDRSGYGNNGTLGAGMAQGDWIDGKIGKAMDFDRATDNYVDFGNPTELQLTNIGTVAAWLKYSTLIDHAGVISKNDWCSDRNGYNIGIGAGDQMPCGEIANAEAYNQTCTTQAYNDNQWHYFVFIWDGSYLRLYVDGVLGATPVLQTINAVSNVHNLKFGKISGCSDYYYDGAIDEVRIYNRALSESEISRLYKLSSPKILAAPKNGLVGYWSFEEGSGTKVGDMSGNGNHGTWAGSGTHWVDGKFGKGGSFNGTDDRVDIGNGANLQITHTGTLSAWMKFGPQAGSWVCVVCKYNTNTDRNGYALPLYPANRLNMNIAADSGYSDISSDATYSDNQWHHMVGTWDGGFLRLYIDGALVKGPVTQNYDAVSNVYDLGFGYDTANNDHYYNGLIDEVRIYNRALEQSEITALYNSGLIKINASQNNQLTDGLVGFWSFNGPDINGNEAIDRGSGGNNGTITGATKINGKVGQALSFDATGVGVNLSSPDSLDDIQTKGTGLSVSMWIKNNYYTKLIPKLIGKGNENYDGCWQLFLDGNDPSIRFSKDFGTPGYPTDDLLIRASYPNSYLGQWKHIVFTWDGSASSSNFHFYIDGSEISKFSETNGIGSAVSDAALNLIVGSNGGIDRFNGLLDEVRVYNRVLEPAEILRLYNLGR